MTIEFPLGRSIDGDTVCILPALVLAERHHELFAIGWTASNEWREYRIELRWHLSCARLALLPLGGGFPQSSLDLPLDSIGTFRAPDRAK